MNHNFRDITGERFGRLVAIKRVAVTKHGHSRWLCQCDCGKQKVVDMANLLHECTHSCGCLRMELSSKRMSERTGEKHANYKHGSKRNGRLYQIWTNMKTRCYNSTNPAYSYYGGRGITICDTWKDDFTAFRDWALANGYRDDLTIERIDVNGNYCPENCRWATRFEQSQNTRRNRIIEMDGERKTLAEWAKKYGISRKTVYSRLKLGWELEKALKTPVNLLYSHT